MPAMCWLKWISSVQNRHRTWWSDYTRRSGVPQPTHPPFKVRQRRGLPKRCIREHIDGVPAWPQRWAVSLMPPSGFPEHTLEQGTELGRALESQFRGVHQDAVFNTEGMPGYTLRGSPFHRQGPGMPCTAHRGSWGPAHAVHVIPERVPMGRIHREHPVPFEVRSIRLTVTVALHNGVSPRGLRENGFPLRSPRCTPRRLGYFRDAPPMSDEVFQQFCGMSFWGQIHHDSNVSRAASSCDHAALFTVRESRDGRPAERAVP